MTISTRTRAAGLGVLALLVTAAAPTTLASGAVSTGYRTTDLGTLGGASSAAVAVSTTNYTAGWAQTTAGKRHAVRWDPTGHVLDLGTLGGASSEATAVDDEGRVVGNAQRTDGTSHAFRWSATSGMKDLGTLGGPSSTAVDINRSGMVAGTADLADGSQHAFIYRTDTGMKDLGTLGAPGPDISSQSLAINDSGQVTGGSVLDAGAPFHGVFVWTPGKGMTDVLGGLPEPAEILSVNAADINEAGRVAADVYGYSPHGVEGEYTVLWDPAQGLLPMSFQQLGLLDFPPLDLNDKGQLTGTYAGFPPVSPDCIMAERAYRYEPATGYRDLIPTACHSEGHTINSPGDIAGSIWQSGTVDPHAFAWTQAAGARDLGTLGGTTSNANGISDSGRVVGTADTAAGKSHATMWNPIAGSVTSTVGASLDSYVNSAAPTTAYGTSTVLSAGSTSTSLLRFTIPAAPAGKTLIAATLRVRTSNTSTASSSAAQAVHLTTSAWSNATTWNTRPALQTTRTGVIGPVPANTPVSIRLTPSAVVPGHQLNLGINGTSTDSTWLWSTDSTTASYRPQLVLLYR